MLDYYTEFSRLPKFLPANAWQLDSASVQRSRACLFSTEWAANSAIRDYGADPSRVHVIPWGCNLDTSETAAYETGFRGDTCHLVFIGVDWRRKGGDIAVDVARLLSEGGYPVKLHIIGARPTLKIRSDTIVVHGYINKSTQEGRDLFKTILKQAAFLLVPTRQDCSPMVFAEANAYGIPVITTRTGGVQYIVKDGLNGYALPIEGTAGDYAELIWRIWSDPEVYNHLRGSSRQQFQQVLNWQTWLEKAAAVIEQMLLKQ